MTYEQAKALTHSQRTAEINRTCTLIDQNEAAGLATQALWEKLETLSCAHGTCGHYTCTGGQDLYEWEQAGRM